MLQNDVLLDIDLTRDHFIKNTDSAKRKVYLKGFSDFDAGQLRSKEPVKFHTKTNEIWHYADKTSRPRNISAFEPRFTAPGAYAARIMTEVVKKIEPGFVSSVNMNELGDKLAMCRLVGPLTGRHYLTGDGGSFDAHRHYIYKEYVDKRIIEMVFDLVAPHLEIPAPLL